MPSFATGLILRRDDAIISWDDISNEELNNIRVELMKKFTSLFNLYPDGSVYPDLQTSIRYLNKPFALTTYPDITLELVGSAIATEVYKEAGIKRAGKCGILWRRYLNIISADNITPELLARIGGTPPSNEPVLDAEGYVAFRHNVPQQSVKIYIHDFIRSIVIKECGEKAFKNIEIDYNRSRVKFGETKKQPSPLNVVKGKLILDEKTFHYMYFV